MSFNNTVTMDLNKTESCLQRFNETVKQWITSVDEYSISQLHQKPAAGSWSLGQVYMHLISDTGFFIGQIKLALADTGNIEKVMHNDAAAMFNNDGFPDIMISNPSASEPPQPGDKEEILAGLRSINEEMTQLCAAYDFERSTGKSLHPGFQYLNALEWLRLAEMHMRHHLRQKKRINEVLNSF